MQLLGLGLCEIMVGGLQLSSTSKPNGGRVHLVEVGDSRGAFSLSPSTIAGERDWRKI